MIRGMFHGGQGQSNSCLALFFVYILVSAVYTKDVGIGYILWYVYSGWTVADSVQ